MTECDSIITGAMPLLNCRFYVIGSNGQSWDHVRFDLYTKPGDRFEIFFLGLQEVTGGRGGMAVDDLSLSLGSCDKGIILCYGLGES